MGKGTLTIYSASAGSGKTYTLTGIYLTHLFKSRYNYRRILAVTFTNKATAEMKSRILENLHKLSVGMDSDYLPGLMLSTGRNEEWLRKEAGEVLNSILHDYSRFSVSTIDSFFQKVLRAFAQESGLRSGFSIELDHSIILSSAVDAMMRSAGGDSQLRSWLTAYTMANIEEEKSWNLKSGILSLAEELFKEKFKILSADERTSLEDKKFLLGYIGKIKTLSSSFEKQLQIFGSKASELFSEYNLSDDMFYRKGQGVPGHIKSLVSGTVKEPNSYVREIEKDPPKWSTGAADPKLRAAIAGGLEAVLLDAIRFYYGGITGYKTANAILSYIYSLGILTDVLRNVHQITTSENSFLLTDAGEVLNLITGSDQSSFIYEKVGNRYENFMIDEFQDTSIIQWKNFRPLIENSMAQGFDNLVVGDVKQSIYRWRNSDWRILGSVLKNRTDNDRIISKPLATNWRSCKDIIRFNNRLFTIIPALADEKLSDNPFPVSFKELYSEAKQVDPGKRNGGYVRIEFIENGKENNWQDTVIERLPAVIEKVFEKGYKPSDIGIIVRDGREGALVLKTLIDYSNSLVQEKKHSAAFRAVSNDSLLLSNSPALNFIISVISVVREPSDMISRALMLRFFLLSVGDERAGSVSIAGDTLREGSGGYFPEGYEDFLEHVPQMPLFEAIERIIKFFGLGNYSWNVAYLNTFQDYTLNFTGSKNNDFQSFLDWWNTTGCNKSVVLPGNQDAIRILTIHKSKGLEFRVVLLPFISWNLDHMPSKQPVMWVKPSTPPFNELGIVPVKYGRDLEGTIFANDFAEEKYSVYIDNINLLYVAFTRAKDAIIGFSVDNPRSENTIAGILRNAITSLPDDKSPDIDLSRYYDPETNVFELGEIPENIAEKRMDEGLISSKYYVSTETESLKLKLHGENYFLSGNAEADERINYGRLMHEIFEGIDTISDVPRAVRKLVLEGKLPEEKSAETEKRINSLITAPVVSDWFSPGSKIMKEAAILLPSGAAKRPDRIIFRDGKTIIVDFKFGDRKSHHSEQVDEYRGLLSGMGYENIEAFIWYVDNNLIVPA